MSTAALSLKSDLVAPDRAKPVINFSLAEKQSANRKKVITSSQAKLIHQPQIPINGEAKIVENTPATRKGFLKRAIEFIFNSLDKYVVQKITTAAKLDLSKISDPKQRQVVEKLQTRLTDKNLHLSNDAKTQLEGAISRAAETGKLEASSLPACCIGIMEGSKEISNMLREMESRASDSLDYGTALTLGAKSKPHDSLDNCSVTPFSGIREKIEAGISTHKVNAEGASFLRGLRDEQLGYLLRPNVDPECLIDKLLTASVRLGEPQEIQPSQVERYLSLTSNPDFNPYNDISLVEVDLAADLARGAGISRENMEQRLADARSSRDARFAARRAAVKADKADLPRNPPEANPVKPELLPVSEPESMIDEGEEKVRSDLKISESAMNLADQVINIPV